ncbi:MotA/TolQ/ExbB proton channel family protein [Bartonella sp. F02]|uniref:MotA/TolQ/ExbB proton channel family protein n=1 Tax=Bartonella sp. F02 TaxID=2967262 RepID=UPI0022A8F80A|nr:MotA/TolQ/ExbB proton channel family protein [Bartonella sp. F02]MCZ2328843.1 MotA/TolQ/ExbB proton channel family protein [Bartonella sp. F02]
METETASLETNSSPFLTHNLSPFSMFMDADWVVKCVIITLLLTSILSWTISFVKIIEIVLAKRKARYELHVALNAQTLSRLAASLKDQKGVGMLFLKETLKEVYLSTQRMSLIETEEPSDKTNEEKSSDHNVAYGEDFIQQDDFLRTINEGVKQRVHSILSRCLLSVMQRISCGSAILATVGSIAPFVGLFATVWGIMNAFIGIAQSQTTRLDVVAPGIAEALLATAVGLFVAIPAVIMYNGLSRALNSYRKDLGDIAAAIERLLSRELDRQRQQKSRK